MGIEIRQMHPLFVGEVSGMDLSRPLDEAGTGALWEAIDRYAVLVFHDQRLSDEQLRDFAGKFGETADEALLVAGGTGIRTQGPTAMASSFGTRLIYMTTSSRRAKSRIARPRISLLLPSE